MTDLNDFLKGNAEDEPVAETPPVETPEPVAEATAPEPEAKTEDEPPASTDGRTVPLAALEKVRAERADHKERAARFEGELAEVRRQLEEAKRGPAIQPQAPQPINPVENPEGFVERIQQVVLNERLNTSELMLRKELGAETVDAAIAEFQAAAKADPSLFPKLYSQPDPYAWMHKQVERIRAQAEIGDDPAAYRAKLEADLRAKWEAEQGAAPVAKVSPAAGLAPSLANARSAASRSAPTFTGPTPLEDLFPTR